MSNYDSLFPFLFGRKGGAKLYLLSNDNIKESYNTLIIQKKTLLNTKKCMINEIHISINEEKKKIRKNNLLNYKRDLFNNRNIDKYAYIINNNSKLDEDFKNYTNSKNSYKSSLNEFDLIFDDNLYQQIKELKNITNQYFFKNGILFSSTVLLNQIDKNNFEFNSLNKKKRKLVLSVLKYLTRSITKTTPYSSFNNIFCLKENKKKVFVNEIKNSYSKFQITNLLYHYLKLLLLQKEEFRNVLELHINSTIFYTKKSIELVYFYNKDNHESFKRINNNQILKFIIDTCSKSKKINYSKLIFELVKVTEESEKNITSYIDTLVKEGLLIIEFPISQTNPNWIIEFEKLLKTIKFKDLNLKKDLCTLISMLITQTKEIESIFDVCLRKEILKQIYFDLTTFFNLHAPNSDFLNKIKEKDIFYEDTISNVNEKIVKESVLKITTQFQLLYNTFNIYLNQKKEIKKYLSNYLSVHKMNILDFYEKIYLKHINNFKLTESSIKNLNVLISECLNEIKLGANEIDISKLIKADNNYNTVKDNFGVYFQTKDNIFTKVIINNFSNGRGANISRFLISFPKNYSEEIKQYNRNKNLGKILCEVKDASINNTNTFPSLSDNVISINEDLALKNNYNMLYLKNIFINSNKNRELILINKDNVELKPTIYSLEGINRRSKFTQFLDLFNDADNSSCTLFLNTINATYRATTNNLTMIPRLVFGNQIIIQRKKWFIKKKYLLSILDKGTLAEKYLAINEWVDNNSIPNEVFLKIAKQNFNEQFNDNYKPQYINFKSSIFILLIVNLIEKAEDIIEVSEMFPNSNDVKQNGGYVKEYILNVN